MAFLVSVIVEVMVMVLATIAAKKTKVKQYLESLMTTTLELWQSRYHIESRSADQWLENVTDRTSELPHTSCCCSMLLLLVNRENLGWLL